MKYAPSPKHIFAFLAVFFLFIHFKSAAQQRQKHTLLWEITGKGLKKPSFLFGSMHIKDRRIFNFSDSVMKAIEACEGFVLEIHPDSITKSYEAKPIKSGKKIDVSKLLTEAHFATLKERFFEKYGYQPDSTIFFNPSMIADVMRLENEKEDDMDTFIDAYLYGIARTMKKNIYGLEKVEDQSSLLYDTEEKILALFEIDEEAENGFSEEMTEIYIKGDIEGILDFISDGDDDAEDRLQLVARNQIMANGMMSRFATESIFTAVGAAHLPGKNGIIALLKEQGYTLRPVNAEFTGVAKTYQPDYSKMDWHRFNDKAHHYHIDFPAMPAVKNENLLFNTVTYPDIVNGSVYSVVSILTGVLTAGQSKALLDTILTRYSATKDFQIINKKEINKPGKIGLDLETKIGGKFGRTLLLIENNYFYTISFENKKDLKNSYVANHFFESFATEKATAITKNNWVDYRNEKGSFSLKLPLLPQEKVTEMQNPNDPENPHFIQVYIATDQIGLKNYIVRYNDFPTGVYMGSSEQVLAGMIANFEQKGAEIGKPKTIFKDGYEGRAFEVKVLETYAEVQIFVRGNRVYLLMRQYLNTQKKTEEDDFFSSFKFDSPKDPQMTPVSIKNLTTHMAGDAVMAKPDEYDYTSPMHDETIYNSFNPNTGGFYNLQSGRLSKYNRQKNVDTLYKSVIRRTHAGDSLINSTNVNVGQIKGMMSLAKDTATSNYKKSKIWLDGDQLYVQVAVVAKEELESKPMAQFFDEAKYSPNAVTFDLTSTKAKLIAEDLAQADTTIFNAAKGALSYYEFEKDELPTIYKILKSTFADDTTRAGVRFQLLETLNGVNDATTVPFLKELFLGSHPDLIKAKIQTSVPTIDSTQINWYLKNLIEKKPLKLDTYWQLFSPLQDSLGFVAKNLSEVVQLLEKPEYKLSTLFIISELLTAKEAQEYIPLVDQYKDQITKNAIADMDSYLANPTEKRIDVTSYVNILSGLKMKPLLDEFTNKVFKLDSADHLHTIALAARIEANLPLDKNLLQAHLDSLTSRYAIINAYVNAGRVNEVPANYKEPQEFSKTLIYNYFNGEYLVTSLKPLGQIAGTEGSYFAFELALDDEEEKYLVMCGPFDSKKADFDFKNYLVHFDWAALADDWKQQATQTVKEIEKKDK